MRRNIFVFLVDREELGLLGKLSIFEPWIPENIRKIKPADGRFQIQFDGEELLDCLSALVAAADFPELSMRTTELIALHEKLRRLVGLAQGMDPGGKKKDHKTK